MRALLINLETSPDRLQFQKKQLNRLGIPFERISATSVNQITDNEYKAKAFSWERPLRHSELACFLSHYNAWKNILESNQAALILEDDALLSKHTPEVLQTLFQESSTKYDLVAFENRGRKKIIGKESAELSGQTNITKLYQDRTGSAGYVLWPEGAKKLLTAYDNKGAGPADAYISSTYILNAYQVEPALIIQLDHCDYYSIPNSFNPTSTISTESKPAAYHYQNKFEQIRFKLRRVKSQLRMGWRQITVLSDSNKRYVKINKEDF